jgi:Arc/MetJ-type ribon-helix-helix transcriptional regulator
MAATRRLRYEDYMAVQKVTVALAEQVVRRAKRAVKQGRARSLSALVNTLLDEQLRRDDLDALFDEWDRERGAPSAEDEAWAARVLGR